MENKCQGPLCDLELLFDPELIAADVKAQLGPDLHVRHCSARTVQHTDPHANTSFGQDGLHALALDVEAYSVAFDKRSLHLLHPCRNSQTHKLVTVGCLFIETKFLRAFVKVDHIEDTVVNKSIRGIRRKRMKWEVSYVLDIGHQGSFVLTLP